MTMAAGTRLGPYEVVAPVGAGGMGEVYRGTDTRLGRVVALKILPSHLSANPDLRERFDREARAISSLSDPHICMLYDVGHHEGTDYLVMEFVEGESLEERLTKSPLPIEQILRYGIEIADALYKAHRHGIVHRDLKPANIMITKSGVKLLDFGLAKITLQDAAVVQLSHLPTAQRQLTQEGAILGTFQYMAPEQLEGLESDARTDIFALGAVLYEMATGRRAFEGKTKTSLIAAIVDRDPPPISSIQPLTPPAFERVVKTCLAKDPEDRWQSARDIANELRWIHESGAAPSVANRDAARRWIPWTVAAIATVGTLVFAALWHRAPTRPQGVLTMSITAPDKVDFDFDSGPVVLSPDGTRIAFVGIDPSGKRSIYVRPLHALTAQSLAGTDNALDPFWSPDSRHIGFFANGKLKKIDIGGGAPQAVCDAPQPRGGTWAKDGTIVFARDAADGLYKIAASGGTVTHLTRLQKGEASHRWPFFLPDGKHLIFLVGRGYGYGVSSAVSNSIDLLTPDTGTRTHLIDTQSSAQYASGYLLFNREQSLVAQPFDIKNLRLTDEPLPVVEGVAVTSTGGTVFSADDSGQFVYQSGSGLGLSVLQWFDRSGKQLGTVGINADYRFPAVSHDSRRVAVEIVNASGNGDIWIFDLARGTSTRLTFDPASQFYPHWSPDDRYVYFTSNRNDAGDIYRKPSTGVGPDEEVIRMPGFTLMTDISKDGRYIAFGSLDPRSNNDGWDIWIYSVSEKKSFPFLATHFSEGSAKFSPDGKWIAYRSDESGKTQAYVQPFPASGGKWQISIEGGTGPQWSPKGDEIFYIAPDRKLMAVPVKAAGTTFEAGIPKPVFEIRRRLRTRNLMGNAQVTPAMAG